MQRRRLAGARGVLIRVLLIAALLGAGLVGTVASVAAPADAVDTPLRILPLGDSITSGINGHDSYRYPLGQSLAASQCGYDFVGGLRGWYDTSAGTSVPSTTAGFTDQDHEGHAGYSTDQILAAVPGWVSGLTFDAVLLHAGQNDFFYTAVPQSPTVSRDRLGAIIDALRTRNPNVIVLLAKPIKAGNYATGVPGLSYSSASVDQLAGLIDGLAASKTTTASPVVPVDLNTGFQTSWLYDGLHPDATGDAWMADRWKAALNPYLTCGGVPANQAPTITSPGARTSTQGTAIAPLTVAASDPDAGQTLTWSATGLPAGLAIAPTTGVITGTPTATGTSTVTVTVTDNGSPVRTAATTFTWTVGAPTGPTNQAPVVTSPGPQTSTQGAAIGPVTVAASDPDAGQALTWSATGLPAGLAIAPTTGVITGTPTATGTSTVTVTVADNGSPVRTGTTTFAWTVGAPTAPSTVYRAVNLNGAATTAGGIAFEAGTTAPNFTAGPNAFCDQSVPLVPATDAATATLVRCSNWGNGNPGARFSMAGVPNGTYQLSVYVWEDNASQTFDLVANGTTVAANVVSGPAGTWKVLGPYTVPVTNGTLAANTSGGDANLSAVVVRTAGTTPANQAPTVSSPGAQASTQGQAIAPLPVSASDPDAGQNLTWSATGLPAGLTISPSTGTITGTPTATGTSTVTVTVSDNGTPVRTATTTFSWTVTAPTGPTNQPPAVTNPGARTSTQGTAIAPLTIVASDPDAGQTLTWSATGLPAGLTIAPATGVITGTPTTAGTASVTITVADNGSPVRTGTTTFTWTVNAPTGPSTLYRAINLNGPATTAGGIAFEGSTGAAGFSAGPNAFCNQSVPLIPATDTATATLVRCSNWGSGNPGARATLTGVPLGAYEASVYVWEDNASETFNLLVNGATVASNVVSGPAGTWKVLGPYPVNVINGSIAVTTSGGAANLSALVVNRAGSAPANQAPTVTAPGAQTSTQGTAISPVSVVASDPDAGQTLTWSATGLPAGLTIAPTTGVITGTPTTTGTSTVTVTVTDDGSPVRTGTTTFTWTVNTPTGPTNQPPVVTTPGAQTSTQGTPLSPLAVIASDPDAGQTLTWSATGLPAGLTIAPTTGVITGTPTTTGTSTVTVTVTDDGSPVRTGTTTFTWTVNAPTGPSTLYRAINLNGAATTAGGIAFEAGTTAPTFTAGPNAFCDQSVPLIPATDTATATLVRCSNWGNGNPGARFSMSNVPNGSYQVSVYAWEDNASQTFDLVINGATAAAGVVSGPAGTWKVLGPYTVNVTGGTIAANTAGGDANLSAVVVRTAGTAPVNQPPTVTSPGARTSLQGTAIAPLTLAASDPDAGQTLTWSATGLPAGLTISSSTGAISGTPTTTGTSSVTVTVADNGTPVRTASTTFSWTVTAATGTNQPPVVTNPGARTSTQGTAIAPLLVAASDPDAGQTLTWSATGLPAGLTIAPATGVITGMPTATGTSTVTITVTDDGTPVRTGTATFTWTVSAATSPSSVYRAINLNGAATTAGGIAFEAGTTAPNFSAGPNAFCDQSVPLIPSTDTATASLIRCSNWGSGTPGARATMSGVPLGVYDVSLYVWEDNSSETFSVAVNGVTVAPSVTSGPAGTWKVLGPFPVDVFNGTIAVTTGGGAANLSALVVKTQATTTVSVTAPVDGTSLTRPTTIRGAAADASGVDHVHVGILDTATGWYWNGSSFQAAPTEVTATLASPGAASTTWTYEFDPPTLSSSPYRMTATAHGRGGSESTPTTRTFTLTTGGSTAPFDPTKVTDEFVAGGNWNQPVSADFLPNGHMLVLTLPGLVYDVDPASGNQSQVLDLTAKVWNVGEAGALDLMVDQAGTGYYVYFAVEGSDRLRISHFTLGSSAEQVIWTHPGRGNPSTNNGHLGGSMDVGPDGKLYLGIGDGFAGSSNDLTNVFGKILRINLDGTVPTDNPYYDGTGSNIDEIWATGFRNPFRSNFDAVTGRLWVGDVGGNIDAQAYEEVDIVERGARYGWPTCEGPLGQPKNGPVCPAGVTGPVFSYPHDLGANQYFNKAIVGGEVYRGTQFPLAGSYVYADYPTDSVWWVGLGADGRTAVADGLLQITAAPTPVWLGVGPDGAIYYVSIGNGTSGQLRRLGYSGAVGGAPVITTATASPRTGTPPLAVTFTGVANDSDGTPITYAWDFGDGATSAVASPTHTYTSAGTYLARLRVTSGGTTVSSDIITVVVGQPPVATITGPADGTTFVAGQSITITGTGSDASGGALPPSALSWSIQFLHNDHAHPAGSGTGSSITLPIPTSGHDYTGNTRYRVELTVTNSSGVSSTTAIVLSPQKTAVSVTSNAATTMTVDGITQNLPHTLDTLIGFQHTVSVPATECVAGVLRSFSSWSDGGARTHVVTVTAGLSLTATYTTTGPAC